MNKFPKENKIKLFFVLFFIITPISVFSQTLDLSKILDFSDIGTTTEEITEKIKSTSKELESEMKKLAAEQSTSFILSPKYPKPNELVSVIIYSSLLDIERAQISWYVDEDFLRKNVGDSKLEITTKNTGEPTKIRVLIEPIEGETIEKVINIMPIEIEILWEADTYTPPFYKGKALISPRSEVKIVVIPKIKDSEGNNIDPKTFVYKWENSIEEIPENISGYGRNAIYTTAPRPYRNNNLSVRISTRDELFESKARIEMNLTDPAVLFYKEHPTEGVRYGHAITDGFQLRERELKVRAVPYFFAKKDKRLGNIQYKWLINSEKAISDNENLTLRQDGEGGIANIEIDVRNTSEIFQSASNSFKLSFGSLNLFRF